MQSSIIVLGIALGLALVVFLIIGLTQRKGGKLNKEFYQERWQEVMKLAQSESGWVQALIEADKLLDDALKKSGYRGKTMGERLVSASRAFSNKDSTWAAHKLRNRVVHETTVKLRANHIHGAIKAFGRSLKDLGAL